MDKKWLLLVVIGVALAVITVGWDLYLTFAGLKQQFAYALVPISPTLYEPIKDHFTKDSQYSKYQEEAKTVQGIDSFK